ncbi:MAG: ABC transporter substrate-binding protein [Actinomycetota bacterium]|nr:ABC transporter substrate-binding protein [Actinomycetota bacterium]
MLAGSVLAACGGDDDDDGGSASEGGGDARPLVVGQVAEPASLDPGAVTAVNDFRINVNLYDGLVQYAEGSLDVEPALATEWTVDDSGTVYTFTLRDDVTFHDGTEFDAEAVKFNFDRMLDENHPQYETGPFPLAEQFFGQIDEVVVNDTYEVEFQLAEPWAPFLSNLAYPTGLLVSPTAVEESGQDFGRNPVGTGPFMFVEWESNQGVTLEANPDYWGGAPAADGVVFRPLVESASRVAELRSGGVDMIVEVPPDDLVALRDDENFQIAEQAGPHVWFLILNAAEPPFDDVRMRQAANYAINREAIVDNVLSGWASVAKGPIAEAFGEAYDPDLAGYDYDPDEAMALIEEAGYGDGVDVTFYVTEGGSGMLEPGTMAEAIQADLAEVGIDASIETYEWNTFLDQVNPGLEGKAAMAEMAWMTNDPGTLPYLTLRTGAFPDEGGFNSGYYSNPEVDELIEQAQVATDPDERADLYHQMQQLVVEDAPWVFVASWKQNAAMTNEVSGFELHPSFLLELDGTSVGG